jgi:hypothetical protein
MDDVDLKMRGEPPMSEEDALDVALNEAMPMIVFWHEAEAKFGLACKEALQEHFIDEMWDIAGRNVPHPDVQPEIYLELKRYVIKDFGK